MQQGKSFPRSIHAKQVIITTPKNPTEQEFMQNKYSYKI